MDILLEDNHLLAVNKPAGLLTQPGAQGGGENLEEMAKSWVKERYGKPGKVFLHAVHRLDFDVSGVVLFARTGKALSRMNSLMRERGILKIYHAVVGALKGPEHGTLCHRLRHGERRALVAEDDEDDGKESVLHYKVLGRTGEGALLELELVTGRFHQIRAQLSAEGMAVVGDLRYGGTPSCSRGIRLHHRRMAFGHPVAKGPVDIEAPYPAGWPPQIPAKGVGNASKSGR